MTEFQWWFSQDQESWQGPFATRDEAIKEGHGSHKRESFYICEARLEDYHQLDVDADEVLEQISDRYEEFAGEEETLFSDVSPIQNIELGRRLSQTLHEWIDECDIKTGIIAFAETRNEEVVEPEVK